jgi:DNA-directed RNA polymerase I subunit RPA1
MRHAAFCTPLDSLSIAGSGLGNVTLGIPRMRELLMTASAKPKTPYMRLALRPEQSSKAKAEELARRWTKITFIELLHEIASAEQVGLTAAADALASVRSAVLVCKRCSAPVATGACLGPQVVAASGTSKRCREYTVRLEIVSADRIRSIVPALTDKKLKKFLDAHVANAIALAVHKELKKDKETFQLGSKMESIGKGSTARHDVTDKEEHDASDDEAATSKVSKKGKKGKKGDDFDEEADEEGEDSHDAKQSAKARLKEGLYDADDVEAEVADEAEDNTAQADDDASKMSALTNQITAKYNARQSWDLATRICEVKLQVQR